MTTRRFPRTLQEAFGPHTSSRIDEPPVEHLGCDWLICVIAVSSFLVVVFA